MAGEIVDREFLIGRLNKHRLPQSSSSIKTKGNLESTVICKVASTKLL